MMAPEVCVAASEVLTVEASEVRLEGLAAELIPTRWSVRCAGAVVDPGLLVLELRSRACGGGSLLGFTLHHRGPEPLALDAVEIEITAEAWPLLRRPDRLRFFQHGFQSWTPSAAVPGDSAPELPLLRSFALMNHFVDSPLWGRKDGLLSSLLTVLRPVDREEAVLLGFTSQRVGLGELFLRNRGAPALLLRLDYGGKVLQPGERLEGERLLLQRGEEHALLRAWARAAAEEMGARVPESSPVGWCSWYEYYTRVRPPDLQRNTSFLGEHRELGVGFVQLDDGYQAAVGDWTSLHPAFSDGLGPIAEGIRAAGFQGGIWTAPFFASGGSRLRAEHPDWFLRGRGGAVATGFNPVWRARTYALDTSHPAVLAWLGEVYAGLVAQGFDYHKIDFLFAGLRHGARHDPSLSPVEAYRLGLAAIRAALGPERFLLGCGAPIGPSIGFVDAMRVSQDVKEQWDSRLLGWAGRGCGYPAAKGALRTNMTRWFMHRSLWVNDPDCLLVREHSTKLGLAETETLVSLLGATGGMLFLSDDLARLSPERLDLAAAVLPPPQGVGRPGSTMAAAFPEEMVLEGLDGQRLVVLVNWSDRPQRRAPPPAAEAGTWYDFWAEAMVEGEREIAPHGVAALRFVPARSEPRILGDSFHLSAAVEGRLTISETGRGTLRLDCGPLARRRGRVLLALAPGERLDAAALPAGCELIDHGASWVSLRVDRAPPFEILLPLAG